MDAIKSRLGPSCFVRLEKVGYVVSAVNGYRDEQWFVTTCKGSYEYRVEYYPTDAFPDRSSPFEVVQVSPLENGA